MSKKKVLIVTESMPYPLNVGGNIAQFEMNNSLRGIVDLNMVFPVYENQLSDFLKLQELWTDVTFFPIFNDSSSKIKRFIANTIYYKPLKVYFTILKKYFKKKLHLSDESEFIWSTSHLFFSSTLHLEPKYFEKVNSILKEHSFDVVQVEFHNLLPLVCYLPPNTKKIYVNHEIRFVREKRELDLIHSKHPFLNYYHIKNRGYELSFMNEFDGIVTVSNDDKSILDSFLPPEKVFSSPLSINYKGKNISSKMEIISSIDRLLFLGGEAHIPNKDGLLWFLDNIWFRILESKPNVQLRIVGQWTEDTQLIFKSKYKNISFSGFVENLSVELTPAVFIVPIRIGSGMRMKILDGVNHFLPFVTTTIGVEGLSFRDGIECLVADSPNQFFDSIIKLLEDQELRINLTNAAQKRLIDYYDHENLVLKRAAIYKLV